VTYVGQVNRLRVFLRGYGFDLLVLIAAVESALEIALGHGPPEQSRGRAVLVEEDSAHVCVHSEPQQRAVCSAGDGLVAQVVTRLIRRGDLHVTDEIEDAQRCRGHRIRFCYISTRCRSS
jgi:hypothetical protein